MKQKLTQLILVLALVAPGLLSTASAQVQSISTGLDADPRRPQATRKPTDAVTSGPEAMQLAHGQLKQLLADIDRELQSCANNPSLQQQNKVLSLIRAADASLARYVGDGASGYHELLTSTESVLKEINTFLKSIAGRPEERSALIAGIGKELADINARLNALYQKKQSSSGSLEDTELIAHLEQIRARTNSKLHTLEKAKDNADRAVQDLKTAELTYRNKQALIRKMQEIIEAQNTFYQDLLSAKAARCYLSCATGSVMDPPSIDDDLPSAPKEVYGQRNNREEE